VAEDLMQPGAGPHVRPHMWENNFLKKG